MAYHQRNIARTAAEPIAIPTLPPSVNPWQSQSTQGAATLGLVLPVTIGLGEEGGVVAMTPGAVEVLVFDVMAVCAGSADDDPL